MILLTDLETAKSVLKSFLAEVAPQEHAAGQLCLVTKAQMPKLDTVLSATSSGPDNLKAFVPANHRVCHTDICLSLGAQSQPIVQHVRSSTQHVQ